ncbi:MAG: hypothetical protein V4638_04035 [Bacteroidota bacterium]
MKHFISLLLLSVLQQTAIGQINADSIPFTRNTIEIHPSDVVLNHRLHIAQSIKYQFYFSRNWYMEGSTIGTFFKNLDGSKKNESQFGTFIPFLNETKAVVGYQKSFNSKNKSNSHFLISHVGYQFYQHGVPVKNNIGGISKYNNQWDGYYILDTTSDNYANVATGFRYHSVTAKVAYQISTFKKKKNHFSTISHRFNFEYSYGMLSKLVGMKTNLVESEAQLFDNQYQFLRNGFRIGYEFQHSFSKHFSMIYGIDACKNQHSGYRSKPEFYTPRGGEGDNYLMIRLRIGLVISHF